MKFKGEKELLADKIYDYLELSLFNVETFFYNEIINKQGVLDRNNYNIFENINVFSEYIAGYRKFVSTILYSEFTFGELKALEKLIQEQKLSKLFNIVFNSRHLININNFSELTNFIKTSIQLTID